MLQNVLVKTVGEFGIFKSFLGTFNVVNLKTKQIASTMNFLSVDEAEKYIEQGVSYQLYLALKSEIYPENGGKQCLKY